MIVPGTSDQTEIEYDELATMKHFADIGAIDEYIQLSCADLGDEFGISNQTASRRLRKLENSDLIERKYAPDGQSVVVNPDGLEMLMREYLDYRSVFGSVDAITLEGAITSGMGRGRGFVSLSGYSAQFEKRLGYEPFPGTLNISLTEASVRKRPLMSILEAIPIDSWEDETGEYGAALCYPATVESDSGSAPGHVIVPNKTDHDRKEIEILAPIELRTELELSDDDESLITVREC